MTQKSVDLPSYAGQFGWEKIGGDDFAIPVIVRSSGIRYSPVRIVEQEIIKKYDILPQSVFQCITLKSYYLTAVEAKLLNNINFNHCNNRYGDQFFSPRDVIISAADIKELSRFLNISHEIFTRDISVLSAHLGIIRFTINPSNPNQSLLVPYISKVYANKPRKFVPLKLVEPYIAIADTSVIGEPSDWDIMHLKMLSIYSQNNSHQHISKGGQIILLDDLLYSKTKEPIVFTDYKGPNSETNH